MRAQSAGGAQRHRRVNAETARFVARRRNHSTAIRLAADNYGLAAQFGMFEQFDRNEKRVHIDVQDGCGALRRLCVRRWEFRRDGGVMLGAEMSELGHGPPAPYELRYSYYIPV